MVNESFARYFFGGRYPLGRRVTPANVTYEIVGVVTFRRKILPESQTENCMALLGLRSGYRGGSFDKGWG